MPLRASLHPESPNSPSCSALALYSCWPGLSPWGESWKRTRVARTAALTRYRYATQPSYLFWWQLMWPFRFVAVSVCGRYGLWPFRFVAISVCGRSGLWPFRFVTISVCGRFGCGRFGLWPLWPVTFCTLYSRFPRDNQAIQVHRNTRTNTSTYSIDAKYRYSLSVCKCKGTCKTKILVYPFKQLNVNHLLYFLSGRPIFIEEAVNTMVQYDQLLLSI